MTEPLTFSGMSELIHRIFRQRHRAPETIDCMADSRTVTDIREMILDYHWNLHFKAIWWKVLTPAQFAREKRYEDARYSLNRQLQTEPLPLPGYSQEWRKTDRSCYYHFSGDPMGELIRWPRRLKKRRHGRGTS